ncbi:MAG TPA: AAA family ATPase [Deltaproteobacteria bacterium]|nr:AAA family ATPase [Deltaproteobacteria bacterium]
MKFYADLHVHSRFSRATSKSLTIKELAGGAVKKGISVLGTSDFTHPVWFEELGSDLVPAEPGLFRLKDSPLDVRFVLTSEISTIYKHAGKVRKVHHLVFAPDMDAARTIATSLARIGNVVSDGRPILGITSRNLLEIVLASSENAFIVPAHIWTPWFSALGSKSGYDTIEDCYEDLAPHIFALETGLSSDPPMNWMVKSLDRYHLISNSDAHSADKLGREATIFDTPLDYFAMQAAMKTGDGLAGTVEFFPEEGKYHLDGHRECNVVLHPEETRELDGICPVCGRRLTVGVLSRVEELADRHDGSRPSTARPFYSLIPLKEILGEIMQVGSSSKRVEAAYETLVRKLGGELPLLLDMDTREIRSVAGEVLALAIERMRLGDVHKQAGYDGRFGIVRVFKDNEADMLFGADIFGKPARTAKKKPAGKTQRKTSVKPAKMEMNPEQVRVIQTHEGCLMVTAGPGTGKTRTLVERIKALNNNGGGSILAITFTTKAAREIEERLVDIDVPVHTFHGLAAGIMRDAGITFHIADDAMLMDTVGSWGIEQVKAYIDDMNYRLSTNAALENEQAYLLETLKAEGYYTYEGLIREATRIISEQDHSPGWHHIMVDEFQDINPVQYTFLKALSKDVRSLMVIGDPNQAIYGFRGSSAYAFDDFRKDYHPVMTIGLQDTYRLHTQVAQVSNAFIGKDAIISTRSGAPIRFVKTAAAGEFIAREIESLAGGLTHTTVKKAQADYALSDIAVIVRTQNQAAPIMESLSRASIPFDTAYARPLSRIRGISQRLSLLERRDWQPLVKGIGERSLELMQISGQITSAVADRIDRADALLRSLTGTIMQRIAMIEESECFKLPPLDKTHVFYDYARLFDDDVDGFIRFVRLSSDSGVLAGEKVHVITAHAAKGLEFKCVFMTGLSQGVFPLADSPLWEEENLFYVAMTRAIDRLYLVCPQQAHSEFLGRIPREHCCLIEERQERIFEQLVLF